MKKSKLRIPRTLLALALTTSVSVTGCRTAGWRPSSLFASRGADSALADSDAPSLPESPAAKHTPGAIASVGAKSGSATEDATSTKGSAYGYTGQTVSTPKAGLAATANGYQTGLYEMGSSGKTPATTATATKTSPGFANPYGGSYSGSTPPNVGATKTPDIALPTSVTESLAKGSAVTTGSYPDLSLPGSGSSRNTLANTSVGYTVPGGNIAASAPKIPSYPSIPAYSTGSAGTSNGTLNSSAYQGATTLGVSAGTSNTVANNSAAGGVTSAGAPFKNASLPAAENVPASATSSGGFAPGTTGRNTNYNFAPTTPATSTSPSTGTSGGVPLLR